MVVKLLEDEKLIKESDNTFIVDRHFKFSITEEEAKDFKRNIVGTVEKVESLINNHDAAKQKKIEEQLQKLELQRESYNDALMNFQKYVNATVRKFKQETQNKKQEMTTFINNFELLKNHSISQIEAQFAEELEGLKLQYDREFKNAQLYKDI